MLIDSVLNYTVLPVLVVTRPTQRLTRQWRLPVKSVMLLQKQQLPMTTAMFTWRLTLLVMMNSDEIVTNC